MDNQIDTEIREIAAKLRRIRELKELTREKFCAPLGENSEYWGMIERGEQPISLVKLLQVCKVYDIPIESVVKLEYLDQDDVPLREEIAQLISQCDKKQLEIIRKFIKEIVLAL